MTYGSFEHSESLPQALTRAHDFLGASGIRYSLTDAGSIVKTAECRLECPSGATSIGRGKGLGDQSTASAIYEAIEHLMYDTEAATLPAQVLELDTYDDRLRDASPDFRLVCGSRPIPLSRNRFASLDGLEADILFPAVLMNPSFSSPHDVEMQAIRAFRLTRYSTNSGTASGVTTADAALHGLLELIERDAVGVELLKVIVRNDPAPVREIRQSSLPTPLKRLLAMACLETASEIVLWEITTELGIPAVLCALRTGINGGRRYFGSGASLACGYAIERAVLEAVQSYHIHRIYTIPLPAPMSSTATISRYQRCYLDAGHFEYRGGSVYVDYDEMAKPAADPSRLDTDEQIALINRHLKMHGFHAYVRTISADTVPVVQVVVPKLERFHLVSYGLAVAPSSRGRGALECRI